MTPAIASASAAAPAAALHQFLTAVRASATIIGLGMEDENLKAQVAAAGISDRVQFAGAVRGEALARLINRHRILVVPSRWEEPFGLVALEGLACGCVVVGARSGGLPEVIGPAGPIVPKTDPAALADTLKSLLENPTTLAGYRQHAPAQLAKFSTAAFIDACEAMLFDAVGKKGKRDAMPSLPARTRVPASPIRQKI